MSNFFDNFMGGLTFGMLASNPFFGGMGWGGFGCGCGWGGIGGFMFGGMYNAVNLCGFANPFPSIFCGYMGGGYSSASGLIMPTTFANNPVFPSIDFQGPCETLWDMYTNPDSDYNKSMRTYYESIYKNNDEKSSDKEDKTKDKDKSKVTSPQDKETKKTKRLKTSNTSTISAKHWTEMSDEEMKQIYGNYSESITTQYMGTAEDLNGILKGNGVLEGKGQAFIDAQERYGISAAVLAAISMNESGHGTSRLARENNNVGGVRISGSKKFRTFSSVEECIMEMARFLKAGYADQGITKLYQVNAKYCPVSDTTDKDNLNSKWASVVSENLHKINALA